MPRKREVLSDGRPLIVNGVTITINGYEAGETLDERGAAMLNNRLIHTAIAVAKRRKEGTSPKAHKRAYEVS